MKKQKYSLDVMEQELGKTIDSINNDPNDAKAITDLTDPIIPTPTTPDIPLSRNTDIPPSQEEPEKEKLIMKNIWVPESVDCQIKLIRAVRQKQRLPNKFNDIANEALVEYIQHHLDEELQSSSSY